MALYTYKGKNISGETVKGQFSGSVEELRADLKGQGVVLTKVEPVKKKIASGGFQEKDFFVSIEQLYHLLVSGMRLDHALKLMINSVRKGSSLNFWELVLADVKQGILLSESIARASESVAGWKIPKLYTQIISVGESVGELPSALKRMLSHLEFRKDLKAELISSLSYPFFLLFMSVVSLFIVVAFIVPRFASVFKADQIENLPLISRVVFSLGDLKGDQIQIFALLLSLLVFLCYKNWTVVGPYISVNMVRLFYIIPFTKKPLQHLDLADVYTALGAMVEGGVDLHRSLIQASKIARLPALAFLLETTATGVKEGRSIHMSWQSTSLIPVEDASLVAVGESSAKLGEICIKLGERHMQQFKITVKGAMSLFEPMMILFLGVAIGFIVTGILLAVLSMTDIAVL